MIVLFTDFGYEGPYVGQVKAVLAANAPGVTVIDLMHDAPAYAVAPAAFLLPALAAEFPLRSVFLAVVDPGVGGTRKPLVVEAAGRWFVGPDNGLFEVLLRRGEWRCWEIVWRPARLSSTFHGRDLFAPVAAALACGGSPEAIGCVPVSPTRSQEWPDDLGEVIYVDRYGNLVTGMRAASVHRGARLGIADRSVAFARTFSEVPAGHAFWHENSNGLVEIAVNRGRADLILGGIGTKVALIASDHHA